MTLAIKTLKSITSILYIPTLYVLRDPAHTTWRMIFYNFVSCSFIHHYVTEFHGWNKYTYALDVTCQALMHTHFMTHNIGLSLLCSLPVLFKPVLFNGIYVLNVLHLFTRITHKEKVLIILFHISAFYVYFVQMPKNTKHLWRFRQKMIWHGSTAIMLYIAHNRVMKNMK